MQTGDCSADKNLFIFHQLCGVVLKSVNHENYLGVMLSQGMTWGPHTNCITSKAHQKLGFIKRYSHLEVSWPLRWCHYVHSARCPVPIAVISVRVWLYIYCPDRRRDPDLYLRPTLCRLISRVIFMTVSFGRCYVLTRVQLLPRMADRTRAVKTTLFTSSR